MPIRTEGDKAMLIEPKPFGFDLSQAKISELLARKATSEGQLFGQLNERRVTSTYVTPRSFACWIKLLQQLAKPFLLLFTPQALSQEETAKESQRQSFPVLVLVQLLPHQLYGGHFPIGSLLSTF